MLGLPEILAARRLIAGRLPRTPLLEHPGLSDQLGAEVWVKHENHQPTGSFKVRGGLHLALSLPEADRGRGLFTASTGNHAQSIAYEQAPWIWLWRQYRFYGISEHLDWTPRRDALVHVYGLQAQD